MKITKRAPVFRNRRFLRLLSGRASTVELSFFTIKMIRLKDVGDGEKRTKMKRKTSQDMCKELIEERKILVAYERK